MNDMLVTVDRQRTMLERWGASAANLLDLAAGLGLLGGRGLLRVIGGICAKVSVGTFLKY